ncbi:hypothetical protein RWV98_05600 [Agathobaculum sp. NTUH-O15-33]|uniref:hypothetical protein n=1 Tax=Agathobaculum sp. NTUH-O15-33 TaxID=3079302 RepID=UPI0029589831|nr:hypothetical protein [Agathobaculum sp. NTUH-O15-33]WNX85742.1 hypothetical protein RWV98_05600 [Agathobaculum sp. NTUH-O15-33]
MIQIKKDPRGIWQEYQQGVQYNDSLNWYEQVKKNENFFIGRQWEGVKAKRLAKPQFNILRRVVNYFVSTVVSDNIAANIRPFISEDSEQTAIFTKIISAEFDRIFEMCQMKDKNRVWLRNAAVHGDSTAYFYFDPDAESGQIAEGRVCCEIIDTTEIIPANPYSTDIQKQRYLLLLSRREVEDVREEARANGVPEDALSTIQADVNQEDKTSVGLPDTDRVTVAIKLWKENGTVHALKTTQTCIIMPERDTEYTLYPVAFLQWEAVRNQFHGAGAIAGEIPNQIFINKMYAYTMACLERNAFPTIIYSKKALPKGLSDDPTEIYGVPDDPTKALFVQTGVQNMSTQVAEFIDKTIAYTRDTMGASDAALGNIKPDNTSAIVAVQKASAAPLELQRMAFYQFIEDYVRVIIDIISTDYGTRQVSYTDENGEEVITDFDFSQLKGMHLRVNIDIGSAAMWSEVSQMQTIDNLFNKQIISDPILYLESLPDGVLTNKGDLIANLKQQRAKAEQQMQMQQAQQMQQGAAVNPENVLAQLSEEERAQLAEHPEIAEQVLGGMA